MNISPPQLSVPISELRTTNSTLGFLNYVWKDWFQRLATFLNYLGSSSPTAQAVAANGTTIAINSNQIVRTAPTGAYTGIILPPGSKTLYQVTIVNESVAANTLTMAASGTSNVADGTSCVILGLTQKTFIWDAGTALWYHS